MEKIKNKSVIVFLVTVLALSAGFFVSAKSEQTPGNSQAQVNQQQNQPEDSQQQNQNENQVQTQNQGENIQVQVQAQEQEQEQEGQKIEDNKQNSKNSENKNQAGQANAEEHRSVVSEFVQKTLEVADRQGGIGQQVREIANQQNDSEETTVNAMEKVKNRNKIQTFLFGSDYKNLGVLRSEIVQTRNRLEQLNREMEKIQNQADKTQLQSQIQLMDQEQEKLQVFVDQQGSKFSLFGWLVKMFNK